MGEAAPQRRGRIHNCRWAAAALLLTGGVLSQAGAAAQQAASPPASLPPMPLADTAPASAASVALPPWDVSTVKPASPDARGSMFGFTPDGIRITNVPLWTAVREAFGLNDDRLFGGPAWAKTSMFDVEAKVAPEDAPKLKEMKIEQRRAMMVSLLEERFGLKYHHETRELPMYELVVAKCGVKMQASKPDPPAADGGELRGNHSLFMHGRGHLESTGMGMPGLVRVLSGQLGRTVVDKTGLPGNYDYKLDWTPDDTASQMMKGGNPAAGDNAAPPDAAGPTLFTALEEQLGLKLEATKGPVDVIVIDELQQPTAN
jgi:uncharacterized protein (TIGR03435 family)